MRLLAPTACLAALLALAACGHTVTQRAATGGLSGGAAGLMVGGPIGGVAGAAGGATVGAATAD